MVAPGQILLPTVDQIAAVGAEYLMGPDLSDLAPALRTENAGPSHRLSICCGSTFLDEKLALHRALSSRLNHYHRIHQGRARHAEPQRPLVD
jgi:hypothetical protein